MFAAVSAFVLALAVAYALSSAGEASVPAGPPGAPAQPIDVASGVAGQTTLGDAEALPALVRKPKPKKQKPQSVDTSTPSTSSTPTVSSPPPVSSPPVVSSPAPSTPASPPVRFEDSG